MFPEYLSAAETLPPRPRSKIVKRHQCTVAYPDGTTGACLYERLGPRFHRLDYRYQDETFVGRLYRTDLVRGIEEIERLANSLSADAFSIAIERERKDWFARACEPTSGGRKADLSRPQMSARRARQIGGRYALCIPLGASLVPVSGTFERLETVLPLWRAREDERQVVGCCSRLDRRWELPRFNPLIAEGHPRREEAHSLEPADTSAHGKSMQITEETNNG